MSTAPGSPLAGSLSSAPDGTSAIALADSDQSRIKLLWKLSSEGA